MNAYAHEVEKEVARLHDEVAFECEGAMDEGDAEDAVCREARTLVDFLDSDIAPDETYPWQNSTPACWIDFDAKATGLLLVLALDAGQPKETRIGAMDALRTRYIKLRARDIAEMVRSHEQSSLWGAQ